MTEKDIQICPLCEKDPTNHSFSKIRVMDGIAIFYTCPAKAKSIENTDIILHYDITLRQNAQQPWIWIFDCQDYPLLLDIQLFIDLVKLICEKYASHLEKIIIIHPTIFIRIFLNIVFLFLSTEVKNRIYISDQTYYEFTKVGALLDCS